MSSLIDVHHENTGRQAHTVVADSIYGTVDNFLACQDRGVRAHMPDLKAKQEGKGARRGIYGEDKFIYDRQTDTYSCPAAVQLKRKSLHEDRQSVDYGAPKSKCAECAERQYCTRNKAGRTIKRHVRQDALDLMREIARSEAAKRDIRTRQHLMERSFARGKRYGYDQSRWRGLWRNQIQEYVTAAIQNIEVLIRYAKGPGKAVKAGSIVVSRALAACLSQVKKLKSALLIKGYVYGDGMAITI
jgi:hypothetical protein